MTDYLPNTHTIQDLHQMQGLPLSIKVQMTKRRISQWIDEYGTDGVYVAFSGGKDSTVLLTLAREVEPSIPGVFVDTGLEFPEIREFVKTWDNIVWIKPRMNFRKVIEKYGYPFISKEVSETVYGARRYLTKVLAENSIPTNERTNEAVNGETNAYASYLQRVNSHPIQLPPIGREKPAGRYSSKKSGSTSDLMYTGGACGTQHGSPDASTQTEGSTSSSTRKRLFACADKRSTTYRTRGGETTSIENSVDSLSSQEWIDLCMILLGILTRKGKATPETIPKVRSKSAFSCQKYQFFLDAPFEIGSTCCRVMKKAPSHSYGHQTGRKPITAEMASESRLRTQKWLKSGCNGFNLKEPKSMPMAFWTEQDVLLYIYENHIPIASVYGEVVKENEVDGQLDFSDLGLFDLGRPLLKTTGYNRTGCMFCGYGCHLEDSPGRFELMKQTHPKQYEYIMKPWSQGGLGYKEVIDWINEHGNLDIRY